jgi:hypothetical protein
MLHWVSGRIDCVYRQSGRRTIQQLRQLDTSPIICYARLSLAHYITYCYKMAANTWAAHSINFGALFPRVVEHGLERPTQFTMSERSLTERLAQRSAK